MRKSVLILSPDPDLGEGVARSLRALSDCMARPSTILVVGARDDEGGRKKRVRRLLGDYARFWAALSGRKHPIVHVNSALQRTPLMRDVVFVLIAKLRRCPTVLSLHKHDRQVARHLTGLSLLAFRAVFLRVDAVVVTTSSLRRAVRSWGYRGPVFVETPMLEPVSESAAVHDRLARPQVLFLSRIVEEKGILEVVRAWKQVAAAHPDARLCVAGIGPATQAVFDLVKEESVPCVRYLGEVRGEYRQRLLQESWVLVLPTTGLEALPTAVMEAMRAGLFVVTTSRDGIAEFFEPSVMGYACAPGDAADIARGVAAGIVDGMNGFRKGIFNQAFAEAGFSTAVVCRRMERVFAEAQRRGGGRRCEDHHWLCDGS